MGEATLIRTVGFRAVHRYWRDDWSERENRRVFGPMADPHTHDYVVRVHVRGQIDEETGFVVDLSSLDRLLEEVVSPLDGSELHRVIPEARRGEMTTSTEGLARWLWDGLDPRIPGGARLVRVRVEESQTLAAEYYG